MCNLYFLLILNWYRDSCTCGIKYGSYGKPNNKINCSISCQGDSNEICGGSDITVFSLYSSDIHNKSSFGNMLGCNFIETNNYPSSINIQNLTAERCVTDCSNARFNFASLSTTRFDYLNLMKSIKILLNVYIKMRLLEWY